MTTISEFLNEASMETTNKALALHLDVSTSMISRYKSGKHIPDLDVASRIYTVYSVVVFPYSEEAIKYHLRGKNTNK